MSRQLGKKNNWGSRSGKNKQSIDFNLERELVWSGLSDVLLDAIVSGDTTLKSLASNLLEKRKSRKALDFKEKPVFSTKLGELFKGDCLSILNQIEDGSIDLIFADPPFNLSKYYGSNIDDALIDEDYLEWTYVWLDHLERVLKPGGSLFIYNIPKWLIPIGNYLGKQLNFRHWISIDITLSMPIPNKLSPSHYGLLYFIKGKKPNQFHPDRLTIPICKKCGQEQKDYGGHKNKMNPKGVNLRDVWTDIPPVRHSKYKNRDANELHIKLLDRIIEMASAPGDTVLDPFGGSGTTYAVAEMKNRKWVGIELGDIDPIIERLKNINEEIPLLEKIRANQNILFTDENLINRLKKGFDFGNYHISEEQKERVLFTLNRKD